MIKAKGKHCIPWQDEEDKEELSLSYLNNTDIDFIPPTLWS